MDHGEVNLNLHVKYENIYTHVELIYWLNEYLISKKYNKKKKQERKVMTKERSAIGSS